MNVKIKDRKKKKKCLTKFRKPKKKLKSLDSFVKKKCRYHPMCEVFQKEGSSGAVSYQPNPVFELPVMKTKRKELRNDPVLRGKISRICDNIYKWKKDEVGEYVDKEEYTRVHRMITSILVDREITDFEKGRIELEDWVKDSKGKNRISKEGLSDALFELTDLWTNSVSSTEYDIFVESLFIKLKYPNSFDSRAYDILSSDY